MRLFEGVTGFGAAAGLILLATAAAAVPAAGQEDDFGWPREIVTARARIVIFQPQTENLSGNKTSGRAAVMIEAEGREEPIFGAMWYESKIDTDRDARTVELLDPKVQRVRFPNITPVQERQFKELVEGEIPKWPARSVAPQQFCRCATRRC